MKGDHFRLDMRLRYEVFLRCGTSREQDLSLSRVKWELNFFLAFLCMYSELYTVAYGKFSRPDVCQFSYYSTKFLGVA